MLLVVGLLSTWAWLERGLRPAVVSGVVLYAFLIATLALARPKREHGDGHG